jgi:hypothetical protein
LKTLADLTAPAEVVRDESEADHQDRCVRWMRSRGYWARKFQSMSQRSVPDYLFARDRAKPDWKHPCRFAHPSSSPCTCCYRMVPALKIATEFKRPGTKPKLIEKYGVTVMSTEAQYEEQEAMRAAGWYVFECDNLEDFKRIVISYEQDSWI